jgi:hypothetical protein
MGVHIGADAKAEDADVALAGFDHRVDNLVLVGISNGGQAIREEDDGKRAIIFAGCNVSALRRAASIAVPPIGFKAPINSFARERFSADASTNLSNSDSVSVANRMISNRSPSFRFSTQN